MDILALNRYPSVFSVFLVCRRYYFVKINNNRFPHFSVGRMPDGYRLVINIIRFLEFEASNTTSHTCAIMSQVRPTKPCNLLVRGLMVNGACRNPKFSLKRKIPTGLTPTVKNMI